MMIKSETPDCDSLPDLGPKCYQQMALEDKGLEFILV